VTLRDRVRDQVRAARLDQGLPETIPPSRFLEELAAEVIDHDADTVEFPAIRIDQEAA
jgi:hypothetical protein